MAYSHAKKAGRQAGRRILSIWLPDWPVYRLARACKLDVAKPLVLRAARQGGERIVALNEAARALGAARGQLLADAQAVAPGLSVFGEDPDADRLALKRLADWCERYTPWTALDPSPVYEEPDGLFFDITGCAHLFGGETGLVQDLMARFAGFGFPARIAIAPHPGAAWALARYGRRAITLIGPDDVRSALDPLPLMALRIPLSMVDDLARLGVKRLADLHRIPRAPLVARFGKFLAQRFDQALGHDAEPISPSAPEIICRTRLQFAEGLVSLPDIEQAIRLLCDEMVPLLKGAGRGARRLQLHCFRSDGVRFAIMVGTSVPSADGAHLAALFSDRVTGFSHNQGIGGLEIGHGIETMVLHVMNADMVQAHQEALEENARKTRLKRRPADLGFLVDRLGNRLGFERVGRVCPRESHLPERAVVFIPAVAGIRPLEEGRDPHDWRVEERQRVGRPLRMLPCAEPVDAIAEVPDGPPRRFRWRRVVYQVAFSEGPERISPEWWQAGASVFARDYYRVEDEEGRRFWLYRDGVLGRETACPQWYVHGVFG
ncbi:MAG: DNA polymerase Y family protein [Parvibaculum sp.]